LAAGTRLGRYEVVSELGTGGMATVYLGRALAAGGFQRLVAIKVLHPHLLRDEQFVQMFLDEGRLAARIHHPNVVATLDLEHTVHGLYIVSEYIEGDILLGLYKNARAQEKRIPFGVTLRIVLDALGGLHAAHELADDLGNPLKIIHRDVSPHNILVGSDGIARITDFGIAKAEERISTTRDGIVKGKLSYMAPEQPNDMPIDRRVDIFSAATVLWECLTGRRLFPGKTDGEVLQALLHKPITRLREVDPTMSPALDEVLAKALARDPDARFDTAADFADALEAAASPPGIANARAVAQYVKEVASAKITAEHERRRLTTRDLPLFRGTPSQVRPIERTSVPPPGPTSDRPPPPATTSDRPPPPATTSDRPPPEAPRATPSQPVPTASRLPPLPATHMAPPPPPPPADARISTPPLEPSAGLEATHVAPETALPSAESFELPSETIPSLVPPPPEVLAEAVPVRAPSDEAPTQLQQTPAAGMRAAPATLPPALPPRASRPAVPPFPRATPSTPSSSLPPLPPVGIRTSVVASVPPPPPSTPVDKPATALPTFAADPAEAVENTFLGLAPAALVTVSAAPSPTAPADTEHDLSLAATTAMAAVPTATPGSISAADDDDAAPTLLAIPAPPGLGRPSRKPAVPAPPPETPYRLQATALPAPLPAATRAPVPTAPAATSGNRRSLLIATVVALGIVLGYGIWAFTDPHTPNTAQHAAPVTVYPAVRAPGAEPATPPPMADPAPEAPVAPEPAPVAEAPVAEAPVAAPIPAPAPVAAPAPAAVAARVVAPAPAPVAPRPAAPVASAAPLGVRRPVPGPVGVRPAAPVAAPAAPSAVVPTLPEPVAPAPAPVAPVATPTAPPPAPAVGLPSLPTTI